MVVAVGRSTGSPRPQARLLKVDLLLCIIVQGFCGLCGVHFVMVVATLVTHCGALRPACGARSRLHERGVGS